LAERRVKPFSGSCRFGFTAAGRRPDEAGSIYLRSGIRSHMGYHVVDPETVAPAPDRPCAKRSISDAAGLENLGCHRYEVDPGDQIPLACHYHDEQEEVFYVLEGTLSVETPAGTYEVEAGTAFAVEPESPHRAYNPAAAAERVEALVVGAPAVDDVHAYEP
jgi:uncharacterized cupin superfamily protein